MSFYLYNRFAKGVANNTSWTKMTWWKTSFNMPVTQIFDNTSSWTQYSWPFTYYGEATSFDLSNFQPGWEVLAAFTGFGIVWPESWTINISQNWKDRSGNNVFTNWPASWSYNVPSGSWAEYILASNQWLAEWEIDGNGTYSMVAAMTGSYTLSQAFDYSITNSPTITDYTPWMTWVEGNDFRFVSANGHLHTVYGIQSWSYIDTAKAGTIWIDTADNTVRWIGNDWYKYVSKYNFQQFSSTFSNWPSPW
jgi:hypothetical protein